MKKLSIALFAILLFSVQAQATNPYWEGYDDAQEGQGEWSDNNKYLDGYEDAQRERENQERIEREREEQRQRGEDRERINNNRRLND